MTEPLKATIDAILLLQEVNTLRVAKLETEFTVLKNLVVQNLAEQPGVNANDLEAKYHSLTHQALKELFESFKLGNTQLSEADLRTYLGLQQ